MSFDEHSKSNSEPLLKTIYLDCNATTLTHPLALQSAREAMELCYGNPSSTHITGLHAKSFLEGAREAAALAVGASRSEEIIFNSGATEGIQSTVFSVLVHLLDKFRETGRLKRWRVLYGSTEHKAVPSALQHWAEVLRIPVTLEAIPVDPNGLFDFDFVESRLPETALLCTMAVNNETGVIQPLEKIAALLNSTAGHDCLWFVDGVQALGKIPLKLSTLGAHYACFSGHKLNAPKGIGFLWVRQDAPYTPMIVGGGQERGKRSGTENLPGAAAFGRILKALIDGEREVFLNHEQLDQCRDKLIQTLSQCFPTLVWNVDLKHCVPTTLNFSVEGISGRELMNAFDAVGIRVSGGSACSSGKTSESHVLAAMKLPKWRAQNAIRMSFGPANSIKEIDIACAAIRQAGEALRAHCMIPHLPAQATELTPTTQRGICELRASDGTRAWLVSNSAHESYLVADCEQALSELRSKLACRGLQRTQVLRLDPPAGLDQSRDGWQQLKTRSGTALLYFPWQSREGHPLSTTTALLFVTCRECLEEVLSSSQAKQFTQLNLLACIACEPTALSAYEFFPAVVSSLTTKIECTKEELAERLKHQAITVLDVREAFESATSHLDDILGSLFELPKHDRDTTTSSDVDFKIVPLSRLPQFIIERLNEPRQERILCVCRSGQRSLQAAELLRRLSGCEALSLKGGLADLLAPHLSLLSRPPSPVNHGR